MSYRDNDLGCLGYVILFVILIAFVGAYSCFFGSFVTDDRAYNALENAGYTDVTVHDKDVFLVEFKGCGEDDDVAWKAEATNPAGQRVSLTVCSGFFFKGTTIRFNN